MTSSVGRRSAAARPTLVIIILIPPTIIVISVNSITVAPKIIITVNFIPSRRTEVSAFIVGSLEASLTS